MQFGNDGHQHMIIQDDVLFREFLNGSDLAFVNLYNRYKQSAYVYCLKILGDGDAAKDVVQGVFLKVYERRSQLLHPERFKSWLLMIARNDCLSTMRKASWIAELPEESEDTGTLPPTSAVEKEEEIALVARAITRLKPDMKEVVILREYENLSYKEIADVVGVTESVVKFRLFSARQQLYVRLKPMFEERR
jgi:RNA polymerase sigma-70 factor (ECF subfamily)